MSGPGEVLEVHGVLRATKLSTGGYGGSQQVTVAQDGDYVRLSMDTSSFPAGLTPDEARHLARALHRLARRVEEAGG